MHQLKLVFEFYEQDIPTDLQNLFTFSRDLHTTNLVLRNARKNFLYIPVIKTSTYGYRSMKFHCAKLWTALKKIMLVSANFVISYILKWLSKNIFSTITLSNNHLLHYKMYIVYQLFYPPPPPPPPHPPPLFPFRSPFFAFALTTHPPPTPPHFYLFFFFLKRKWSLCRLSYDSCMLFLKFADYTVMQFLNLYLYLGTKEFKYILILILILTLNSPKGLWKRFYFVRLQRKIQRRHDV